MATATRLGVFCLSKNEYDLIDDFCGYYSALVGAPNVVVVDHGSDDARVLEAYERHRAAGGVVLLGETRPIYEHGAILTDAMRARAAEYDWMLPIDTDEFAFDKVAGPAGLLARLAETPDDVSVVRFGAYLQAVPDPADPDYVDFRHRRPARSMAWFEPADVDKVVVRASTFVSVSQGNHHAAATAGRTVVSDRLGLLHFGDTGAGRRLERCTTAIRGYGHLDVTLPSLVDLLAECDRVVAARCWGGHRVDQFRELMRRQMACRVYAASSRRPGRFPTPRLCREICARAGREARADEPWHESVARVLDSCEATEDDVPADDDALRAATLQDPTVEESLGPRPSLRRETLCWDAATPKREQERARERARAHVWKHPFEDVECTRRACAENANAPSGAMSFCGCRKCAREAVPGTERTRCLTCGLMSHFCA